MHEALAVTIGYEHQQLCIPTITLAAHLPPHITWEKEHGRPAVVSAAGGGCGTALVPLRVLKDLQCNVLQGRRDDVAANPRVEECFALVPGRVCCELRILQQEAHHRAQELVEILTMPAREAVDREVRKDCFLEAACEGALVLLEPVAAKVELLHGPELTHVEVQHTVVLLGLAAYAPHVQELCLQTRWVA